jgi:hypothetical protein
MHHAFGLIACVLICCFCSAVVLWCFCRPSHLLMSLRVSCRQPAAYHAVLHLLLMLLYCAALLYVCRPSQPVTSLHASCRRPAACNRFFELPYMGCLTARVLNYGFICCAAVLLQAQAASDELARKLQATCPTLWAEQGGAAGRYCCTAEQIDKLAGDVSVARCCG